MRPDPSPAPKIGMSRSPAVPRSHVQPSAVQSYRRMVAVPVPRQPDSWLSPLFNGAVWAVGSGTFPPAWSVHITFLSL